MAKNTMKKGINALRRGIDEIINSYEETPQAGLEEYLTVTRKAG